MYYERWPPREAVVHKAYLWCCSLFEWKSYTFGLLWRRVKTTNSRNCTILSEFFFISVLSRRGEIEYFCSFSGSPVLLRFQWKSLNETVLVGQCHFLYLKFLSWLTRKITHFSTCHVRIGIRHRGMTGVAQARKHFLTFKRTATDTESSLNSTYIHATSLPPKMMFTPPR